MSDAITPRRAAEAMREQAAQEAEQTSAHGLVAPLIRESIAAAIRALPLPDEPEAGAGEAKARADFLAHFGPLGYSLVKTQDIDTLRALLAKAAEATAWVTPAMETLAGYEKDCGEPLDDLHEIGRIDDSRHTPSFRFRVGHLRKLAAALAEIRRATQEGGECA